MECNCKHCAQVHEPLIFGLGAHKMFHYVSGSLCLPGAQPQPLVLLCCAQKSYIPYLAARHYHCMPCVPLLIDANY